MSWQSIIGFRLITSDLDRATAFYQALGFDAGERRLIAGEEMSLLGLSGSGSRQLLTLGPSRLELDSFERLGRPYPPDADAASLCFQHLALVTSDAASAWARASQAGATAISRGGPVTLPDSAGSVTAVKFRDPDGHPLELLQFPDSAAKKWHGQGLLSIDHSAISVSDVAASRAFYGAWDLHEGKASLNAGPTQVSLDGLDGVQVDVVPLEPKAGTAHLELLGYRWPRGRSAGTMAANDVAATRLVWRADRVALVRDPDGHLHQLVGG